MRRLYRLLLRLYPARFREEYAESMERQFGDEYREARRSRDRAKLGLRALADFVMTAPVEIARELRDDLCFAARIYRRRSLATALALAALAVAIGATTGVFSVVNAVLIRALPFREPERLVELWMPPVSVAHGRGAFSAWKEGSAYLDDAAGYAVSEMNLGLDGDSARVRVAETSAGFLRMLGVEPVFGRGFAVHEDTHGRNAVAVIGYGLWQQVFGGDPRVLGSTVRLNGVPLTVVGVAPRGSDFPERTAIWTPTIYDLERLPKSGAFAWRTIGRLKSGVSMAQASGLFQAEIQRAHPGRTRAKAEEAWNEPRLSSLRDRLAGPVRPASMVLMGMVTFVLLIACANVAHLLLTRTTERRQELSIRAALGASRARLVQQLVTEALALTAVAAIAGLAVAQWTSRLAGTMLPPQIPARLHSVLDWPVLGFALGLAVLTGLTFGVLPASLIGRMQPGHDVVRTQPGLRSWGTRRMRGALVAVQAALTVALAAGAFSMGRSFLALVGTDLGYRTERVVTLNVSLSGTRHEKEPRHYYREALARLRAAPGVENAAAVSYLPLISKMFMGGRFKLDSGQEGPMAVLIPAGPGYFRTMGTEVIEGREFVESDRQGPERVAVISDDLAQSFGSGPLVGRQIDLAWGREAHWSTIVGIVRAQRYSGPGHKGGAQVFVPIEQSPPEFVTFVARVRGDPEQYLAVCRDAVRQTDREVPVYDVKTLDQRLSETLARPRFFAGAMMFFAAFALLLAVAGSYGVAAYSVAQRTHEIGVRLAVGASPHGVRRMLLRQNMPAVAIGVLAGMAATAGLGRFLQHLIAGAEPPGPWLCLFASLALAAAAAAAVWTATGNIVRMDPTAALKSE